MEEEKPTFAKASAGKNDEKNELAEMEHKYKLALADYQNLLKQTTKERTEIALYANEALILDMLPVYDNLKLSLFHFPQDGPQQWKVGLEHVVGQFKKSLEDNGMKEIETKNKKFDHSVMEAVKTIETDDEEQDEMVAEELKGGYKLHDKVLIPARVAVYKFNTPHPA